MITKATVRLQNSLADTTVLDKPVIVDNPMSREHLADTYQVVLWNDDYNEAFFVVRCLVRVFGHPSTLAFKIMFEAHRNGKSIAEVEGEEPAALHCRQLQSFGLTSTVEKI